MANVLLFVENLYIDFSDDRHATPAAGLSGLVSHFIAYG